jgi:subtilase family serine protease
MRSFRFACLALCLLALTSTISPAQQAPDRITGAIDTTRTITLSKSLHPRAQSQYDRGPVEPSLKLDYLTLLMTPSPAQQQELNQLLSDQQNPQSPFYHQWLTPAEYAARFGLSQNDLNKIANWLHSEGFQILSVGGGHNSIAFSGTAAQAEHAFGTQIHNYEVDGTMHFANSTPVRIPAALQGIVTGVTGLHSFLPRPASGGKTGRNLRPAYYDGNYIFPNFLAPGDIATIYNLPSSVNGTGQQLAIVGQTDVYLADINDFRSGFGLAPIPTTGSGACTTNSNGVVTSPCTTTNFAYVVPAGFTDPGLPNTCGDLGESDLDIEWSGAVASGAQIVFVNSPTIYDSSCNPTGGGNVYDSLQAVINPPSGPPLAPVVSMSYNYCEIGAPDLETLLKQGNAEGVTIMNSAGDVGSTACDYTPPNSSLPYLGAQYGLAVNYPASSPEVTGVGGTEITLANDSYPTQSSYWNTPTTNPTNGGTATSYIPEIPWNDDEEFANYCHSPAQGDTFCSQGGSTPVKGWVALGSSATAEEVQEDIWIYMGGGGASNCWYVDTNGVCLGAGAGGFAQPSYQQGLSVTNAPSGVRWVPDVSMFASPEFPGYILCTPQSELGGTSSTSTCASGIFDAVDTYGSIIGGTSASSPVFAGIVTLLNQYVVSKGIQSKPGLGNINTQLYKLAASNSTNNVFHQYTTGDNMVYCQVGFPQPIDGDSFPSGVVCPSSGVFGFEASNTDSKTGYNLVNGLGSVNAENLLTAWAAVALPATSTTLTSSQNPANLFASVTFTATVTTTGSTTPTGTVTFYNGSTSIGTGTLNGSNPNQATFTTSSLTAASNSITATYGGDSNNASSTSAALIQAINQPTLTLAVTSTPPTTPAGESAPATVTVATNIPGTISLSCSGPAGAVGLGCTVSPTSISATSTPQPVMVTITTSGPNGSQSGIRQRRAENRVPLLPFSLPLAGIVFAGFAGRKGSKHFAVAALCVSLALAGLLIACGGSSSSPPVEITMSPASASVYPNYTGWPSQSATFTATVSNTTNTAVNWSLSSSVSCSASSNPCGTISGGSYTAPTIATGLPSSVTVIATSQALSTATAQATVGINPATVPTAVYGSPYTITVSAVEGGTTTTQNISLTTN